VKLLLNDERVDINKGNKSGAPPFLIACLREYIEIMKYLLVCGRRIDINKKDSDGKTAIDIARERGKMNLVEFIKLFQKNQNETRTKLRKELDLPG